MNELMDRVALVTGGGRGIGRGIALALGKENMRVAILARSAPELAQTKAELAAMGVSAMTLPADVTVRHEVEEAVREVESTWGAIDLLVNNAGSAQVIGPLWETDPDAWWRDVEVNLRGTLLCCHAVLPGMIHRRGGRIINIASGAASMTLPMSSSYACAKAGVVRLTDSLAASTKEHGVAVFAVSPGPTRTAMTEHLLRSPEGRKWMPEFERIVNDQWTPLDVIGRFVVALARGDADLLSGRFLNVRQELAALVARSEEIVRLDLLTLRLRQ